MALGRLGLWRRRAIRASRGRAGYAGSNVVDDQIPPEVFLRPYVLIVANPVMLSDPNFGIITWFVPGGAIGLQGLILIGTETRTYSSLATRSGGMRRSNRPSTAQQVMQPW